MQGVNVAVAASWSEQIVALTEGSFSMCKLQYLMSALSCDALQASC